MLKRTVKGAVPVIVEPVSGVVLKEARGCWLPGGFGIGEGEGVDVGVGVGTVDPDTVTAAEQRAVCVLLATVNDAL
jgi:hypothetical protein